MKISVCTLAHGREDHLCNLVRGLNRSHRPPCELVVAVMQDQRYELPETGFPVRQVMLVLCSGKMRRRRRKRLLLG